MRRERQSPLRLWVKVILVLLAVDFLLFKAGLVWRAGPNFGGGLGAENWHMLFAAAREIETRPVVPPTTVMIGSSVVIYGAESNLIRPRLRQDGVPDEFIRFTTHGCTATDAALLAWNARSFHPWLVIYGAAARDFPKFAPTDSGVVRTFYDASVDLPALAPHGAEERLDAVARRYWKLYRYRFFTFTALESVAMRRLAGLGTSAHAAGAAPDAPVVPPEAMQYFEPFRIMPKSWAAWDKWRHSRRFDDYLAWVQTSGGMATALYKTQTLANFGPAENRHAEALRWMLESLRRNRTRVVLLYFPENPVFRDPEAKAYFDPTLSQAYADLFAREAETHGARFEDLRNLLAPEDFYDLIHANLQGQRKLSARIAEIVEDEWRVQDRVDK